VALAPAILADRSRAVGDAIMMHAKEVAASPLLANAIAEGDRESARRIAFEAARAFNHAALVIAADGTAWDGPAAPPELVEATRRGEMPAAVLADAGLLYHVSIAPVLRAGRWVGAAGVSEPIDEAWADALAGLSRSDLVFVLDPRTSVLVSSSPAAFGTDTVRALASGGEPGVARELRAGGTRYIVTTASMAGATVVFVRDLRRELAILPQLRRVLLVSGAAALALALLLGSLLALLVVRPVRGLAAAADRLSRGDFDAPLSPTPVRELERVTRAFDAMRQSLAGRIEELRGANRLLEERQARLAALQAELIRRERVAVSGRMAVELAHEIRNPVANLRNCLELLHRRLADDAQGREYAALAIDELLRMHELAERMLDLNRSHDGARDCDAAAVARDVAALALLGGRDAAMAVTVEAQPARRASIPPEALKQVLLNFVQNARQAVPRDLDLRIAVGGDDASTWLTVSDNGPGVPGPLRARIFDPFFTTRPAAGGMGLGLFLVEGVVRGFGGSVSVADGPDGRGATFRITVPASPEPA
jgi:signal transduction histidine kinase